MAGPDARHPGRLVGQSVAGTARPRSSRTRTSSSSRTSPPRAPLRVRRRPVADPRRAPPVARARRLGRARVPDDPAPGRRPRGVALLDRRGAHVRVLVHQPADRVRPHRDRVRHDGPRARPRGPPRRSWAARTSTCCPSGCRGTADPDDRRPRPPARRPARSRPATPDAGGGTRRGPSGMPDPTDAVPRWASTGPARHRWPRPPSERGPLCRPVHCSGVVGQSRSTVRSRSRGAHRGVLRPRVEERVLPPGRVAGDGKPVVDRAPLVRAALPPLLWPSRKCADRRSPRRPSTGFPGRSTGGEVSRVEWPPVACRARPPRSRNTVWWSWCDPGDTHRFPERGEDWSVSRTPASSVKLAGGS